ncbi:melanopsin [Exaiptasia diaphana]|uniref:G-protein coupled receptors family 1 profile domain-containing protein n=1 Tax=Exaiptasia diaphana TaxID=2652724 RepID=A0A913Y9W0_EXADI|nr:melanopsin [Exaiptasia diaphana]
MQEFTVPDAMLLVLSGLVVATNVAVCWLVIARRVLRTYTNGFVVSLAVSDILSGGIFMPVAVLRPLSTFRGHVAMMVIVSSTLNLSAVAFDRYLAVVRPLAYKSRIETSFIRIVVAVWGASGLMSVLPVFWKADETLLVHKVYLSCAVILFLVLPLVFILFVYTFIFVKLRQHGKLLRNLHATRTRIDEARRSRRESKSVKMFFIILAVFATCWIPVIYMTFAAYVANRLDIIPASLTIISHYCIMLSSLINPFLYTFMKLDFQREVRAMLPCKRFKERARPGRGRYNGESMRTTKATFLSVIDAESKSLSCNSNSNY